MKKRKIEAVKLVKENLNMGLKKAKDYVEEIERKINM
jgi:ribosomal protein L7/L12